MPVTILLILLIALLNGCGGKQPVQDIQLPHKQANEPQKKATQSIMPPQNSQEITNLLLLAEQQDNLRDAQGKSQGSGLNKALSELQRLSYEAPSPLKEEAAFRRIELLLKYQRPNALTETNLLLLKFPNHALTPYAHFWLATWWKSQSAKFHIEASSDNEYNDMILDALSQVLLHPRLTDELRKQALALGRSESNYASQEKLIQWYLAAALVDTSHQDAWLRLLASSISLGRLLSLQETGSISPQRDASLYLHFARLQLMAGNIESLQTLSDILSKNAPYLPLTQKIKNWASGDTQEVYIGVLLPLTGRYARFGQEALNGIRLAVNHNNKLHLYIEDTGAGIESAIAAYQRLSERGAQWVIGPLLSKHTEALLPYLQVNLPVISLSKENSLAEASPALFIHNTAKNTQAVFIARHSIDQGIQRMALIYSSQHHAISEANAFTHEFTRLGGKITDSLELSSHAIDHRHTLHDLRESSDDEELLETLLSDLALFSPETNLDVHMPVAIDALYIAASGKQVSELAGQLAYVDIRGIPMLGSSRWVDGHLLDDRGRNLSSARFTQNNNGLQSTSSLLTQYREIWGQGQPTKMFIVAYDSALIINLLGSRLGLQGNRALEAVHDPEGFPSQSGHVYFDQYGIGNKIFKIFKIKHGKFIPEN
ncbi:MAG: penicillin-binding protein activator [Mariprofundaceae bacterium]|nr:penicillin-binding protein activator [Mariprofundaceae bacterium]